MKIKATNGQSIASRLTAILTSTLPTVKDTNLNKNLGTVKPDAKSKGKAVLFTWRKGTYRLSENLKVMEQDFTNTFIDSSTAKETEAIIKGALANETANVVNTVVA
jgi:hypothetical protein